MGVDVGFDKKIRTNLNPNKENEAVAVNKVLADGRMVPEKEETTVAQSKPQK